MIRLAGASMLFVLCGIAVAQCADICSGVTHVTAVTQGCSR